MDKNQEYFISKKFSVLIWIPTVMSFLFALLHLAIMLATRTSAVYLEDQDILRFDHALLFYQHGDGNVEKRAQTTIKREC